MGDLIERLRSNQALPLCPFERRSPEYFTTPNDKPCKFCGGLPEGPDKCTGADMRIMGEAADALAAKDAELARLREALKIFADEAMIYDPPSGDDHHMAWSNDFPIGALRKARAALTQPDAKSGEDNA